MKTILAALILGISPLLANPLTSCCPSLCEPSIGAEWIYFSPNSESPYYAVLSTVNGVAHLTELENNKLDRYYSGFRVFGRVGLSGAYGLFGRFGNLEAKRSSSIVASPTSTITNLLAAAPFPVTSPFTAAQARSTVEYWEADGLLEMCLCRCGCFETAAAIGVHYAWIHSHHLFTFTGDSGALVQRARSDFWGVGPEVAFNARAYLWRCFSLFGSFAGAAAIGEPRVDLFSSVFSVATADFTLKPRSRSWRTAIYVDARLGVSYTFALPFCCLRDLLFKLEAGYEALAYLNALRQLNPANAALAFASGQLYLSTRNFTLHGPFISGTVCF